MNYSEKDAEKILLKGRTDDNIKFSVTTDYDISSYTISFLVETRTGVVDLSEYCIKTGNTDFIVDVPTSIVSTLENAIRYKVGVVLNSTNKDFLFGGKMNIEKGISL